MSHFRDGASQPDAKTGEQARALAAYMRTLRAPETAFDQGRMSASALRGEAMFVGKGGCAGCHIGPTFTDGALHDLRVPQAAGDDDPAPQPAAPCCTRSTPPSCVTSRPRRPTCTTARWPTLRDVVRFYDQQSVIAPLGLTDAEVDDLVGVPRVAVAGSVRILAPLGTRELLMWRTSRSSSLGPWRISPSSRRVSCAAQSPSARRSPRRS